MDHESVSRDFDDDPQSDLPEGDLPELDDLDDQPEMDDLEPAALEAMDEMVDLNELIDLSDRNETTPDNAEPEDKQDDAPPPWYDPGLNFSCTRCGNCCSGPDHFVTFTEEEGHRMAGHLKLKPEIFFELCAERRDGRWMLMDHLHPQHGLECVFLGHDPNGQVFCKVHPVRPRQCASYPFHASIMANPETWRQAAKTCPGMRKGGRGKQREADSGEFFPTSQIRIILADNPPEL